MVTTPSADEQDDYPGPSSSTKRKNDDIGNDRKKRSRVSYSCSECHRRKQKCDRKQPCSHCIARRVPELCQAYQPGKGEGDLHVRLARVERILEMALPQFSNSSSPGGSVEPPLSSVIPTPHKRARSGSESHDESPQEEEIPNNVGTLQENGPFFGASALGSVNSKPILEQFHTAQIPTANDAELATEKLRSLVQDCGVPPHKVEELVRDLPPKSYSDDLLKYFFTEINWTRHPIYEPYFRASYENLLANGHRVHALDIRFLPLLFIVLANAARLGPDHLVGDERQRRLIGLRYYWSARRSMMIAAAVGEGLELVLARLLISRFLAVDRRIAESWNILGTAVRTALALGLHRDGTKLGLDPFQTEYRRRIWAYIYHADRSHALVLGRPPCIQDEFCDALPPTNADDSALSSPGHGLPLTSPTPMTYVILRHSLAVIIGHIVRHFQQVCPTHYSDVIALDEELQHFIESLPSHYSLEPDTSLDSTHPFLPPHRYLIITEVFFVRISLHRPYMLRKLDSDRFAFSRRACFESAKSDFQIRQRFRQVASSETIKCLGGGYREFQTSMISGISLALDPHGPDAVAMHKILDTYLSNHLHPYESDETTRRELKIIELLKSKSLSVAAGEPLHSPPGSHKKELPVENGTSSLRSTTIVAASRHDSRADADMLLELGRRDTPNGGITLTPSFASSSDNALPRPSSSTSPVWGSRTLNSVHTDVMGANGKGMNGVDISNASPLDDEESAQRLLDNWVNNAQIDSVGGGTFGLGGIDAGAVPYSGWNPLGFEGDGGAGPFSLSRPEDAGLGLSPSASGDPSLGEWNYWGNLVEHIRASGGMA